MVALHARRGRPARERPRRSTARSSRGCSSATAPARRGFRARSTPSAGSPRAAPLGLASSSNRELIDAVLAAGGIDGALRAPRSRRRRSRAASPRRTSTSRRRGGSASTRPRASAVEDSHNGIRSAKAAGMRVRRDPERALSRRATPCAEADVVLGSLGGADAGRARASLIAMKVEAITIGPSDALGAASTRCRPSPGRGSKATVKATPGAHPGGALTLIEAEVLEDVGLTGPESRRQVVVRGVRLNDLVGQALSRRRGRVPRRRAVRAVPPPRVADTAGDHQGARPPRRA